jgi:hypothetical protein
MNVCRIFISSPYFYFTLLYFSQPFLRYQEILQIIHAKLNLYSLLNMSCGSHKWGGGGRTVSSTYMSPHGSSIRRIKVSLIRSKVEKLSSMDASRE